MGNARLRRSLVSGIGAELDTRDRHIRKAAEAQHRANVLRRMISLHDRIGSLGRESDKHRREVEQMTRELADAKARTDAVLALLARSDADHG